MQKNVMDRMEEEKKEMRMLIKKAKEDTLRAVERAFQEIEAGFIDKLEKEQERTGLHKIERLDELYSQLSQKCLEAYQLSQDLSTQRNPSLIKKVNNEFLAQALALRDQLTWEITDNENFTSNMKYHSAGIWDIENAVRRLISTSFSYPVTEKIRNSSRTPLKRKENCYGTFNKAKYEEMAIQLQYGREKNMSSSCTYKEHWAASRSPLKTQSQLHCNTYT